MDPLSEVRGRPDRDGADDDHGLPEALNSVPRQAGVDEGGASFVGSRYFASSGNSHWLDRPLVLSVLAPAEIVPALEKL